MSTRVKARTRGYIKDNKTGSTRRFLFNPNQFTDSHGVTYNEIASPGSAYPRFQYVRGQAKTINVELFLYSHDGDVESYVNFLNRFTAPVRKGVLFNPPPTLIFAFGSYVVECILETIDVTYTDFDERLEPTQATVRLGLKAV